MLPSYIEDDMKAQIMTMNCMINIMSHLPFFDEGLNLWDGLMIVPVRELVMILFDIGLSAGIA